METPEDRIIMVILILIFPPLAVWFKEKSCGASVCLNICLLLLFFFPALIHAVYVCFIRDSR